MTFDEEKITEITIGKHGETTGISDAAFEKIPAAIIENQSLGVDTISGATYTSQAILDAVADCVTQAGGDAFNTCDPERQKDIPMTEALSSTVEKVLAHEDVSEEHAKLKEEVQKQWDEYKASGNTMLFDTPEWHALQSIDAGDYEGNVELVRAFTSNTLDTLNWLSDNGVEWTDQISTVVGALWNRSHQTPNNSGADIIAALETNATKSGVDIYLDTKAEELLVEDGRVAGAVLTNSAGTAFCVL